jgi:hypothetical protein
MPAAAFDEPSLLDQSVDELPLKDIFGLEAAHKLGANLIVQLAILGPQHWWWSGQRLKLDEG